LGGDKYPLSRWWRGEKKKKEGETGVGRSCDNGSVKSLTTYKGLYQCEDSVIRYDRKAKEKKRKK